MTDRDRAWDAEHHRAALQIIAEADRGLKVAEQQLKAGRLMDARETVRIVRGLMPPLERAIQRRPVRAEEPIVRTVGDLTARHQLTRPRIRVAGREGSLKIVKPSDMHPGTVALIWGDWREDVALEEPCEVLP